VLKHSARKLSVAKKSVFKQNRWLKRLGRTVT